jgi:hypothetical protein
MVSNLTTAALGLAGLTGYLRGRTPLCIAAAGNEITGPAQGAVRGGVTRRTLLETLPRQCADETLAEPGEMCTLGGGERFQCLGDCAFARSSNSSRERCSASRERDLARPAILSLPADDVPGQDEAIDEANGARVGQTDDFAEGLNGSPRGELEQRDQCGRGDHVHLRGVTHRIVDAISDPRGKSSEKIREPRVRRSHEAISAGTFII